MFSSNVRDSQDLIVPENLPVKASPPRGVFEQSVPNASVPARTNGTISPRRTLSSLPQLRQGARAVQRIRAISVQRSRRKRALIASSEECVLFLLPYLFITT